MIRVVTAEDLKIGDVVHLHTDTHIVRIRLVKIERRRAGFKITGYRMDDPHQISPWATGYPFGAPVEIDAESDLSR